MTYPSVGADPAERVAGRWAQGPSWAVARDASGGDQLVVVAVDAVAQAVRRRPSSPGHRDRPHDLADLALAAEQVAPLAHPAPNVRGLAMELERPRVDRRPRRPTTTGVSAATTSRMFIRHGRPSMTSRQPSQRIDTLSSTIVPMRTPRYSIAADGIAPSAQDRRVLTPALSRGAATAPRARDRAHLQVRDGARGARQRRTRPASAAWWCPQGIRTPDLHLERVASWASRRWGRSRGQCRSASVQPGASEPSRGATRRTARRSSRSPRGPRGRRRRSGAAMARPLAAATAARQSPRAPAIAMAAKASPSTAKPELSSGIWLASSTRRTA